MLKIPEDQKFMDKHSGYAVLNPDGSLGMFNYDHKTHVEGTLVEDVGVLYKGVKNPENLVTVLAKDYWLRIGYGRIKPNTYLYMGHEDVIDAIIVGIKENEIEKIDIEKFEGLKLYWKWFRSTGLSEGYNDLNVRYESILPIGAKRATLRLALMSDNIVYMDYHDIDFLRSKGQSVEKVDDGYTITISFTDRTNRWSVQKMDPMKSGLVAPLKATLISV